MANIGSLVAHLGVDTSGLRSAGQDFKKFEATTSAGMSTLTKGAVALASAFAGMKIVQYAKDAALSAARYETLGVVMQVVGNNAGYTGAQMEVYARGLQKAGIAMIESRATLTRMAQAQIDLSKSSELARIAQDAAVIGNINSSEAFERMIHGIQSGQIEILRTIGINVNFENSYAKLGAQIGKNAKDLTELEKMTARTNVVMEAGVGIAGTYEAAMGTAGKMMLSLTRLSDDLKTNLGEAFGPSVTLLVEQITEALKGAGTAVGNNKSAVQEWGANFRSAIISIEAEIIRLAMLLDKIGGTMTSGGMLLTGVGAKLGIESSKKRFEAFAAANINYEERYAAGEVALQALADKEIAFFNNPPKVGAGNEAGRIAAGEAARTQKAAEDIRLAGLKEAAKLEKKLTKERYDDFSKTLDDMAAAQDDYTAAALSAMPKEAQAVAQLSEEYKKKQYAMQNAARYGLISQADANAGAAALALNQQKENLAILNQQEEAAYAYDSALEQMGKTGTTVAEDLNAAFTGWASDMSKDLNDMLWSAKATFGGILESFGKMITQMYIQKQILEPAMAGLNAAGGIGGILGSLFGSGGGTPAAFSQVSAYDSMVGASTDFSMAGGGIIGEHIVGRGLSSGKSYEFGENGPEAVLNKSQIGGGQSQGLNVEVNVINQSGQEVKAKVGQTSFNLRGAVVNVILEDVGQNGPLRGLFAGAGGF